MDLTLENLRSELIKADISFSEKNGCLYDYNFSVDFQPISSFTNMPLEGIYVDDYKDNFIITSEGTFSLSSFLGYTFLDIRGKSGRDDIRVVSLIKEELPEETRWDYLLRKTTSMEIAYEEVQTIEFSNRVSCYIDDVMLKRPTDWMKSNNGGDYLYWAEFTLSSPSVYAVEANWSCNIDIFSDAYSGYFKGFIALSEEDLVYLLALPLTV